MALVIKVLADYDLGNMITLMLFYTEPLVRHPDFRLFACMNPATDVGKRNLPLGIRNRLEHGLSWPGV